MKNEVIIKECYINYVVNRIKQCEWDNDLEWSTWCEQSYADVKLNGINEVIGMAHEREMGMQMRASKVIPR